MGVVSYLLPGRIIERSSKKVPEGLNNIRNKRTQKRIVSNIRKRCTLITRLDC